MLGKQNLKQKCSNKRFKNEKNVLQNLNIITLFIFTNLRLVEAPSATVAITLRSQVVSSMLTAFQNKE